jgi:hypothetical protein
MSFDSACLIDAEPAVNPGGELLGLETRTIARAGTPEGTLQQPVYFPVAFEFPCHTPTLSC